MMGMFEEEVIAEVACPWCGKKAYIVKKFYLGRFLHYLFECRECTQFALPDKTVSWSSGAFDTEQEAWEWYYRAMESQEKDLFEVG